VGSARRDAGRQDRRLGDPFSDSTFFAVARKLRAVKGKMQNEVTATMFPCLERKGLCV